MKSEQKQRLLTVVGIVVLGLFGRWVFAPGHELSEAPANEVASSATEDPAEDDAAGATAGPVDPEDSAPFAPRPVLGPQPVLPEVHGNCIVAGLDELTDWAERIVLGRVVKAEARWAPDRSTIYTYYTVQVRQALKGTRAREIEVRVIGGQIESVHIEVSHQPEMRVGDEGLLFIDDDPGLYTQVAGSVQGFLKTERQHLVDGFGRAIYSLAADRLVLDDDRVSPRITTQEVVRRVQQLVG